MKKADVKIGFSCNNHCLFCVQGRKRVTLKDKTAGKIKSEMKEAAADCGGIVFTGGEPTIRGDFLDLIKFAKKLKFKTIQIQSNGRMFAYRAFCEKVIRAGANEFAPAIHGHKRELHDYLTSAPGSFDQVRAGIVNLKELGQKVITNTVITKPNFRNLEEIARLLSDLEVDQFQFAFVHATGNAKTNFASIVPRFPLMEPFVKKGLDIGRKKGIQAYTEAIPYCFMSGYEDHIAEKIIPPTKIFDFKSVVENFTEARQKEGKAKGPACPDCRFNAECEGPWREYPEKFGWGEFRPVKGKKK